MARFSPEDLEPWVEQHGGPLVKINSSTWAARDGAILSQAAGMPEWTSTTAPPEEPLALLSVKREYHGKFLEEVDRCFQGIKSMVRMNHVGTIPWSPRLFGPPPGDVKENLEYLKGLHREHKTALEKIESEIEKQPAVVERRQREEALREAERHQAEERRRHLQEIDAINLD